MNDGSIRPEHEACLDEMLGMIVQLGHERRRVSVHDVQDLLGERGFGPFLLVPAVLEVSPLGAIPGFPTAMALLVILAAVQLLVGRRSFWLPGFIGRRGTSGARIEAALGKVRRLARFIDRHMRPRMQWLTREPFIHLVALVCVGLAATVPMLELVPFASSIPFAVIGMLGLGLMVRDGVFVGLGAIASLAAFFAAWRLMG